MTNHHQTCPECGTATARLVYGEQNPTEELLAELEAKTAILAGCCRLPGMGERGCPECGWGTAGWVTERDLSGHKEE